MSAWSIAHPESVSTAFDLRALEPYRHFWSRFAVSHISQKTSEIWGTLSFVAELDLNNADSFLAASGLLEEAK
jgi:hypothetical protein